MKSPAAERRRPTLWDGVVALLVVAAAILLLLRLRPAEGTALTARVVVDGDLVASYELSALTQPDTLTLDGVSYPLTIELAPGRVRIAESCCPNQDCVHTGWVQQAGGQIICLPNHLVISLTGEEPLPFDAVTG